MRDAYTGAGSLFRNNLRGQKVITLLIIILPFLFAYGAAASNVSLLQTPQQLSDYISQNQGNALLGSIDAATVDAVTVWRIRVSAAIILSILNIVLMVGHTRKEEDLGRLELLRAGAVGSLAPLAAAYGKLVCANLLGGLLMAAGFMAVGFGAAGSLVSGMSTALCCLFFMALAALFAQIAPNAQLARGLSFGAAVILLFVQVIANIFKSRTLLLFTPFGWCAYARPFAGENPWPFVFAVPVTALLITLTLKLCGRRDLGAGYLRERGGRAVARKGFASPFALCWRLQRSLFFTWTLTYALMGLVIASLRPSIDKMLGNTMLLPELAAQTGGSGSAFLAILTYILAQVLCAFAIMAILRMRDEEARMRAELMLSHPVSRTRYALGYLLVAFGGSALALGLFGFLSGEFAMCFARLPAIWAVASVAMLVYGLAPRAAPAASYGVLGVLLAMEFLWEIRVIGSDVFSLSPFYWVYPGVEITALSVMGMLCLAVLFTGVGLLGFARRNIVSE